MVCRVVRYCTVSMATASSSYSLQLLICLWKKLRRGNVSEKLRGVCGNHVLDFISNPFAATYPRVLGDRWGDEKLRRMHFAKSIHVFGAMCIARMSNVSMIR